MLPIADDGKHFTPTFDIKYSSIWPAENSVEPRVEVDLKLVDVFKQLIGAEHLGYPYQLSPHQTHVSK